jgi:hypothetical protein
MGKVRSLSRLIDREGGGHAFGGGISAGAQGGSASSGVSRTWRASPPAAMGPWRTRRAPGRRREGLTSSSWKAREDEEGDPDVGVDPGPGQSPLNQGWAL